MKPVRIIMGLPHRLLREKSIQSQLLLTFIFITLIPILLVGYMTFRVSSSTVTEEVKHGNGQLMGEIERNVLAYFHLIEIDAQSYASRMIENNIKLTNNNNYSDVFHLESVTKINDELFGTFEASGEYLSIRAFSDGGDFISSAFDRSTNRIYSYLTPDDAAWRRQMAAHDNERLIYDVHPIENGLLSLTASKAVMNPFTGQRIGYMSFDKKMKTFASIFKPFEARTDSRIQLVKSDGKILYHTERSKIGYYVDPSWIQAVKKAAGPDEKVIHDRTDVILLRYLPSLDCYIIGMVPLSYVYEQRTNISNVTLLAGLIAAALVVILSLFLSASISRPIKQLSRTMQQVEQGQLSVKVPVIRSSLETMLLSRSFGSMISRLNELVKTQYEMEIHKKDAELKALMMQINPHFLYNTLEVISGMAEEKKVERISELTQSLSKMLRYNIDLKHDKVRIAEEVENCMHFFAILKYRFEDRLQIETDIDARALPYQIVKTVLQPLIENSVKYSVEKKLGHAKIRLSVQKRGAFIEMTVEDNGTGFASETLEQFTRYMTATRPSFYVPAAARRIGLRNVYDRLRLVFGPELSFDIQSSPETGTTIRIRFPAVGMNSNVEGTA